MKNPMSRIFIPTMVLAVLLLGTLYFVRSDGSNGAVNARGLSSSSWTKLQQRLLSGSSSFERDQQTLSASASKPGNYFPTGDDGCPQNIGSNVKVNQNCLNLSDTTLQGRSQAQNETAIAQDPNNPDHIVGTSNDYRRGDGNCGPSFSLDGGGTWTDSTLPTGFTPGATFGGAAREYWQAGGDPSVAWDSKGNAYLNCQVFQRGPGTTNNPDQSSAIYVFRSTHNNGASWNFTGRPVVESFVSGTTSGLPFLDKPYMTVDNHKGSPFQDRVYVTWTLFNTDGTANIFEAFSNDFGESFSKPVLVSSTSPLCPVSVTTSGHCDANQFSQPFTGPDGALYVTWANFNNAVTAPDNHNQILLAKSTDGGNTFSPIVKVANYYDLPDCATYQGGQDAGRACIPEKGTAMNSVFRAVNYPSGGASPLNKNRLVVTVGSYINMHSNEKNGCAPNGFAADGNDAYTGVKTPGACNNDILISVSNDGGTTFTGTTTDPRQLTSVNMSPGQATTDQFWQWATFSNTGRLAVSYYDRQYGKDEFTGFSDISLSGVDDPFTEFHAARATSSSMPLPTEFPNAQGNSVFYGDYTGLSALGNTAHPLWMDTRSPDLALCPGTGAPGVPPQVCTFTSAPGGPMANDQDLYTAAVTIPS